MAPRSRLPLSPSMEARLSGANSTDSLISTGSNQELKSQLDSTLAEVEAIAEHLEKQKKPEKNSPEFPPKPTIRRKTSEQLLTTRTLPKNLNPENGGARPRERVSLTSPPNPVPRTAVTSSSVSELSGKPVMLRQSSWASREQINNGNPEAKSFSANKSIWERRSSGGGGNPEPDSGGSLRGGFRTNRDFWNQRASIQQKQKQTPDLVLDLPGNPEVKPKPRPRISGSRNPDSESSDENSGAAVAADQFANNDRNTLRKNEKSPPEETNPEFRFLKKSPP